VILYLVGIVIGFVFRVLPIKLGYAVAHVVGYIVFRVWRRGRTSLRENLRHVLGSGASREEIDRLVKAALRNYVKYLLDYTCLPRVSPEEVRRRVDFEGWDNLVKALKGKGAILVGLHQGYWEITGGAVVLGGYPLNVVVESMPWARLDRFMQDRRRGMWMNVIPMENGVKEMLRALRRNEHLVLLIDIPNSDGGVEVKFGDALTRMPRGAATLALKTGASVVPMASVRRPDNTLLTFFGECIDFQPSGSLTKDVQALTQAIMNALEPYIMRYPEQYYMFRRMWPEEPTRAAQRSQGQVSPSRYGASR